MSELTADSNYQSGSKKINSIFGDKNEGLTIITTGVSTVVLRDAVSKK